MVTPKEDITAFILIARGAPTQRDVTKTDSGGRKGRIALQNFGNSLHQCRSHEINTKTIMVQIKGRARHETNSMKDTSPVKKQSSGDRYYYNLHNTSHHSFNINR